ncbi:MAG: DUF3857 domain-containing protein [Cytophagaceae bacterium]|nr:DUF3857 domain-containing protein [Cytophagaceae bacterium]MDW8456496.1 DUF3857 domain-containing protein [Cytophagaceae bacterium]
MKNAPLFYCLLFTLMSFHSEAQQLKYADYSWEEEPKLPLLKPDEKNKEELVLKEKYAVEFLINKEENLEQYELYHKITYVNSDKSIEANNRVYIPSYSEKNILFLKTRVITKTGRIILFNEKDIKEATDEKSKVKYKFYAIEGLEAGSVVEYLYLHKTNPTITGVRKTLQSETDKKNVEIEIISPAYLIFKAKSYNGLPEMQADSVTDNKRRLYLYIDYLPGLKIEEQAYYKANLQYLIYKIDKNTNNNISDIISYGGVSEKIYKNLMSPLDKSSAKAVKKLIEKMNISSAKSEAEKIKKTETYIKYNFTFLENDAPMLSDIQTVISKKIANEQGIVRLFTAIFNELKIDYQLVLTCDRSYLRFDPNFEAYNFLTDYLIYFPSIKQFLMPFSTLSCLGFPPPEFTNNYGLFIKKLSLESYHTGVGKVNFIPPPEYNKTNDIMYVTVNFKDDIIRPNILLERSMTGYYARYYQPYYSFCSEENKKKITDEILKNHVTGIEIKKIEIKNEGIEHFGISPFIVKAEYTSDNIVEKAGNKYLFRIGELIGPQMEMYQKEERTQDIENNFNRNYHREINFEIPQNYKIENLDILNMDVYTIENNQRVIAFTSQYSIKGNHVSVIIDEYYKKLKFPPSEIENYRKVINAAADFNKLVLFLEPLK